MTIENVNLVKSLISIEWKSGFGRLHREELRLPSTVRICMLRNIKRNPSSEVDKCVILR